MNIFIANLSFDVNDAELRACFEQYGSVVSVRIPTDRETPITRFRVRRNGK